ncbi:MAG: hypothetical protein M3P24_11035, partial [Gemmatimonadota bacterium]|nr:hypothetical protein [Gemmatimonadota bacterium]
APPAAPLAAVLVDRRGAHRWGRVTVVDPYLGTVVHRLAGRSASFRGSLAHLAAAGIPVVVGTPEQLRKKLPREMKQRSMLAMAVSLPGRRRRGDEPGRVPLRAVLVVIDLPLLREVYDSAGVLHALENDVAVTLAHEISGHALGWVEAQDAFEGCLDPGYPEILSDSTARGCAVERENRVRREIGVVERPSYLYLPLSSGQSWEALDRTHLERRKKKRRGH